MKRDHDHARALIVQSDGSLLVDVQAEGYDKARMDLASFAQIVKTPGNLHTYRITPVSLWNAAAAGWTSKQVKDVLTRHARYDVPDGVFFTIEKQMARWGQLVLDDLGDKGRLRLTARDEDAVDAVDKYDSLKKMLSPASTEGAWLLAAEDRGNLKQVLSRLGYPVIDCAGYTDGAPLPVALRDVSTKGERFSMRPYQTSAVEAFLHGGSISSGSIGMEAPAHGHVGGHGVVVLPCGGGKTIVGIGAMARLGMHTLILATGATAVRQWIFEILDKTGLSENDVGEYTGQKKQVRPVTVATYQIATRQRHRMLFESQSFGLIIYDEVHLLPAPLFRTTAYLQARRRLGMTATLVREDGREAEVFSLIGPKRYELPWRALEEDGWVAKARCEEIRVEPPPSLLEKVEKRRDRDAFRLFSESPKKDEVVEHLVCKHRGQRILIIGQYLSQLRRLARRLGAPLLTGEVPQDERDVLFRDFREGRRPILVVSRVANFSVDLPDASVCIQVSGLFGSRQEEAQRLGRILRPKLDGREALFYTLVTPDTREQHFALARQRFLTEQGYRYVISSWRKSSTEKPPREPSAPFPEAR